MGFLGGTSRFPEIRKLKISMLIGLAVGLVLAMILTGREKSASGQPQAPQEAQQKETANAENNEEPAVAPPAVPMLQDVRSQVESLNGAMAGITGSEEGDILSQQEEHKVNFTINAELQKEIEKYLQRANPPEAAFVAINPKTGEVLALVGYENGKINNYRALEAGGPAASIFKLVTASALVEGHSVKTDASVCFRGGKNGIKSANLKRDPSGKNCETLTEAVGRSTNAVVAILADELLSRQDIHTYADRFGFNRHIPFFWPMEISKASVPEDRLQRANMAAGFHYSTLSPLHAALIAAALANDGVMMAPRIVKETIDPDGQTHAAGEATVFDRVLSPKAATLVTQMMMATTSMGTAAKYFRVGSKSPLYGINVAGKTGSLSSEPGTAPRLHYSWFVGFAPAEDPEIAIAALTVNPPNWVLKSGPLAKMGLETYFRLAGGQNGFDSQRTAKN